jgi:hypothetical protein
LFNLRHSSARNAIERIFGIFKRRFKILKSSPEYDMHTQALIPAGLAALHNFIRQYDPEDLLDDDDDSSDSDDGVDLDVIEMPDFQRDHLENVGELGRGAVTARETARANERRDRIAGEMWEQYRRYLESRPVHAE